MSDIRSERENSIFSQDIKSRVNMARQGNNLDVLMHDNSPMVRREVALRGYGLENLSKDEASIVREAVARCGYNSSAAANDSSSIVRKAADNAIDTSSDKYNIKAARLEAGINKIDKKLDKLNTAKSTHRVRMYSEYDAATNSNRVHLKLETTKMSAAELAQHKHDNRGLLHKVNSHLSNDNVGLVYAKLHNPLNYGSDGKRHLQSPITFHSVKPPKLLQKAGNSLWNKALAAEAGLIRAGDTTKRLIVDPASQAAKAAVLNKLNEASRDNLGVDITVKGGRTALAASKIIIQHRKEMLAYKPIRLQNKRDRLAARADKARMKAANAHHKAIFNAANERAKNKFGLNPSSSKDKAAVKGSWTKIYDGAEGKNYIAAPEKKKLDKNSMSKAEYKQQKRMNRLEQKEFKYNKKAYETVSVKQSFFNSATGKTEMRTVNMVDKSRPKKPKVKKPQMLGGKMAMAGLGELRNKAFNAMSQNDNVAVQAAGKGANLAFSEFSKAHAASLKRKEKLFEKRKEKARMKAARAHAKLQVKPGAPPFNSKKTADKVKKLQKKRLTKNRNMEMFKQRAKELAKKAKDEIVKKLSDFIAGKGKVVVVCIVGGVALMLTSFMLLAGMGGGAAGGGTTIFTTVSIHPVDNVTLTNTLLSYNGAVNNAYRQFLSFGDNFKDASGNLLEGIVGLAPQGIPNLNYEMNELASRFSALFHDDWNSPEAQSALSSLKNRFSITVEAEPVTVTMADEEGNPIQVTKYLIKYWLVENQTINDILPMDDSQSEHYNILLETQGGHQIFGPIFDDGAKWRDSALMYDGTWELNKGTYDIKENCLAINCSDGKKVIAGADGKIISKSNGSIQVKYDNDYIVTYYYTSGASLADLPSGASIKEGDLLFKTGSSSTTDGKTTPSLQISVYEQNSTSYVNPYFLFETYDGQREDNSEIAEDVIEEGT